LLFKKSGSIKERANAALASLQRNAYAMGLLRSRLESRINFILSANSKTESHQELTRVLELVKNGEMILHEMSEKIESTRYLEDFIMIIESAASSVSEIKDDIEQMVPAAEAALEEMHDAISKVSGGHATDLRHEVEPSILAEVKLAIAACEINTVNDEVKEESGPAQEKKVDEPERVPA
jgi:phage shock protein A